MTPVKEEPAAGVAQEETEDAEDAHEAVKEEAPEAMSTDPPAGDAAKSDPEDEEDEDDAEAEAVSAAVLNEEEVNEDAAPPQIEEEVEEEEHSLLDPPLSSIPRQPSQSAAPEEPQGPKPRLVIHKMALVNFKSYAGRQEIGPFHKSFSAIVGPNGSGKSNTIDALLFVFGYRASKMRQGKLSELIHNSANHPNLPDCSVEVHFREIIDLPGPDAFELVPGSKLVVTRTAYRNNSSKYSINGRSSTYSEVQTLLKGRGIDLDHNRFLILQGEVESIAQMKPKAANENDEGLLEYLEDIVGTSQYKEPIDEALVEVERLTEDRQEKLSRLRIVDKDRKALESKKKEAEDYLRMVNDLVRARSRLWQWYIWKCLENESQLEEKIGKIEHDLQEERDRNQDDINHFELLQKHYDEKCSAYEEVQKAAAEAVKDLAAREKTQISLEEKRKHANTKAKKLKKAIHDDEHARAEADRTVDDSAAKIERKRDELESLEQELSQAEKVLEEIRDSLKDKTQVFHDQIEVKQKELQPWMAKIDAKQAEIDVATSERDALKKKAEAAKEAREKADAELEQLHEDHQAKKAELQELEAEKTRNQREIRSAEKEFQDAQANIQGLRAKASASRQKVDEAKSSQEQSRSNNRVLDTLIRLKTAGRIQGFHGRLGSLGTIEDKYDIAISTACGQLGNMVVDTVEQGQACIEYLRNQNVGRASFMVLEKISGDMRRIQTPDNVPRLFDLIKPKEPKFAPAFYKALRDTLVVDTLEQANRIAFGGHKRWRVVTLAGQLIDASGTMSGGGTSVQRGGMSSKLAADAVPPEVIRKYQETSEEDARALDEAVRELRELEAKVEALKQSAPRLDLAIDKVQLDIRNAAKRIADTERRVKELKSQSKPDANDVSRIATLDRGIDAATAELEKLQGKANAIEAEIKALEKKILEIGGARLLSQKSKVDGLRLHINLANDEITKAEVAKAKAEKDRVKHQSAVESNTGELEDVQRELADLEEQLEECAEYMAQLRQQVDVAQTAAEKSSEALAQLKEELDEKSEHIQAFRQKEMKLKQELEDTKKSHSDNKATLEHWSIEHDKLQLEDIDEEEEGEEGAAGGEGGEGENGEGAGGEGPVKKEPGARKSRARTPSHELHSYSEQELGTFKKRELLADAELLDEKVKNAKPDLSVLKDYRQREEEFLRRAAEFDKITKLRDAKKEEYEALRKRRLDEFMAGFSAISLKLKEMYQMITLGGNAELELVDSMDPFSEGIIFSVMPPKKSWKNISNLSGGEKTLSSLALVFALHVYKPTPLYFMDEIDAALDFRNVSIVANYIKDRTKNAQFIIISLRNDMFELSHRLIGIYKTANATRSISIDNHALHAIPAPTAAPTAVASH
ncbi:RecF/RecN/SMC protein [Trametes versicolor FP-101664 SS1]|uniref:RecF/RecN/SMC protein n=1 Tax=Trametes versicolor (strain FP-101664) TaxID=717944 RepID=UPI00046245DB|nr:RecF/RecN/SMC protein [Trametes versicolor FP-101664 SS1]EIW64469.1 RecF/RecN/SMC protein [Trametes versicolor FP-101664 SS1]